MSLSPCSSSDAEKDDLSLMAHSLDPSLYSACTTLSPESTVATQNNPSDEPEYLDPVGDDNSHDGFFRYATPDDTSASTNLATVLGFQDATIQHDPDDSSDIEPASAASDSSIFSSMALPQGITVVKLPMKSQSNQRPSKSAVKKIQHVRDVLDVAPPRDFAPKRPGITMFRPDNAIESTSNLVDQARQLCPHFELKSIELKINPSSSTPSMCPQNPDSTSKRALAFERLQMALRRQLPFVASRPIITRKNNVHSVSFDCTIVANAQPPRAKVATPSERTTESPCAVSPSKHFPSGWYSDPEHLDSMQNMLLMVNEDQANADASVERDVKVEVLLQDDVPDAVPSVNEHRSKDESDRAETVDEIVAFLNDFPGDCGTPPVSDQPTIEPVVPRTPQTHDSQHKAVSMRKRQSDGLKLLTTLLPSDPSKHTPSSDTPPTANGFDHQVRSPYGRYFQAQTLNLKHTNSKKRNKFPKPRRPPKPSAYARTLAKRRAAANKRTSSGAGHPSPTGDLISDIDLMLRIESSDWSLEALDEIAIDQLFVPDQPIDINDYL